MAVTKYKPEPSTIESVEPDRLYHPDELGPLTGLGPRRLVRMMDEGRIGYVIVGRTRCRMIEGRQYLDWKASRRVEPEAL